MSDTTLLKLALSFIIGYVFLSALEKLPEKRTPGQTKMIDGLFEHGNELLKEYQDKKLKLPPQKKDEEANSISD